MKFIEKNAWPLVSMILLFLSLSACHSSVIQPVPTTQSTAIENRSTLPTTSQTPTVPVNSDQDKLNPLTGLEVVSSEILNRRPVMIKVSNYPALGRPHAGLAFADLVFDYYIGTGQNRVLAVFLGRMQKA